MAELCKKCKEYYDNGTGYCSLCSAESVKPDESSFKGFLHYNVKNPIDIILPEFQKFFNINRHVVTEAAEKAYILTLSKYNHDELFLILNGFRPNVLPYPGVLINSTVADLLISAYSSKDLTQDEQRQYRDVICPCVIDIDNMHNDLCENSIACYYKYKMGEQKPSTVKGLLYQWNKILGRYDMRYKYKSDLAIDICGKCKSAVLLSQISFICRECLTPYHEKCADKLCLNCNTTMYSMRSKKYVKEYTETGDSSIPHYCKKCEKKIMSKREYIVCLNCFSEYHMNCKGYRCHKCNTILCIKNYYERSFGCSVDDKLEDLDELEKIIIEVLRKRFFKNDEDNIFSTLN